ncbi:MAG: hypothetical protein ABW352_04650, partial [Polyangiales bacterium]
MPALPPENVATALKAGNRTQFMLTKDKDPVYLAKVRWNQKLVTADAPVTGNTPPVDGVPWTAHGDSQPRCWPYLKLSWRQGFDQGPDLRFEQTEQGTKLTVVFDEDSSRRVAGCVPFDVSVKSVELRYGNELDDVLSFEEILAEPGAGAIAPTFKVEASASVPLEARARVINALQTPGIASWRVRMEFVWLRIHPIANDVDPGGVTTPTPSFPADFDPVVAIPASAKFRPGNFVAGVMESRTEATAAAVSPNVLNPRIQANLRGTALDQSKFYTAALKTKLIYPIPTFMTTPETVAFERTLRADFPKGTPENRAIYAAIDNDYGVLGWRNTAHGWFQPTSIQDTVYCLPSAYRLRVDERTGMPSIQALLLRATANQGADPLDPKTYTVRLTLKVAPDFDVEQLHALRALVRSESHNTVRFADLVLGGYSGARFVPDPSLAGLGELFAGSVAGQREIINPEYGFTLTYEGNAEFIDLLFQRLKSDGIEGAVELDLHDASGNKRTQAVPVVLSLRKLASVALPWGPAVPDANSGTTPPADDAGAALAALPRSIELRNPSGMPVTLARLEASALQRSPVTGQVQEWARVGADGSWPRTLQP